MERISLNTSWQFSKLPEGETAARVWESVTLPHTWYRNEDPYHGPVVYRRQLTVDPVWHKVFLEFEGADQICRVYINGALIGEHRGAYARFRFPVPEKALQSGALLIEVLLDNRLNPEVSPNFGDFTVFGGLYRSVNLLICGEEHFDYCFYGTDGVIARASLNDCGDGLIALEPHVCAQLPGAQIRYTLHDPDGAPVAELTAGANDIAWLPLKQPRLWNGKGDAKLYTLHAALLCGSSKIADETDVRLGFRRIDMNAEEGLHLNGELVKLHGVSKHQDRAGVFNAVTEGQIDEDFDLIREIGANAVRLSHYQHAQHSYDRCDEDGLLVWAEIPMLKMTENEALFENAKEQLTELILQNIHHPSIFCWGIQNEIAMFRDAPYMHDMCRELSALAKAIDPSRLTTAANLYSVKFSSMLNQVTDMVGYNIYFGWYYGEMTDYGGYLDRLHAARPERPVGVSEYGVDGNPQLHAEEPKVKDYSEEYQALFHETVWPVLASRNYLWGSFVWNMFDFSSDRRDEGGVRFLNAKGLVSYDRSLRKDAFYYYKAVWSEEPFVHLCSSRFVRRCREKIDVKVYTNQPDVRLILNGLELGSEENNGNGTVLFPAVALQPGENEIRVLAGSMEDRCVFERVEIEDESYRLPEVAGGAVRNWFLSDDDTVKEGYYSIMDTADDLLQCNDARAVLADYVPHLLKILEQDLIPLGLSMKSILGRDLKDDTEKILQINNALHLIPKEDM